MSNKPYNLQSKVLKYTLQVAYLRAMGDVKMPQEVYPQCKNAQSVQSHDVKCTENEVSQSLDNNRPI